MCREVFSPISWCYDMRGSFYVIRTKEGGEESPKYRYRSCVSRFGIKDSTIERQMGTEYVISLWYTTLYKIKWSIDQADILGPIFGFQYSSDSSSSIVSEDSSISRSISIKSKERTLFKDNTTKNNKMIRTFFNNIVFMDMFLAYLVSLW